MGLLGYAPAQGEHCPPLWQAPRKQLKASAHPGFAARSDWGWRRAALLSVGDCLDPEVSEAGVYLDCDESLWVVLAYECDAGSAVELTAIAASAGAAACVASTEW